MSKSTLKPVEDLSYEEAFAELEGIVALLEGEQKALDESLALFERGQALMRRCAGLLEQADLKVQQLTANGLNDFTEA
ncbi:MAG: exodeoxyribonuclease VII small subunit [Chloroflexota bacterium]